MYTCFGVSVCYFMRLVDGYVLLIVIFVLGEFTCVGFCLDRRLDFCVHSI